MAFIVADVAEHGHASKIAQPVRDGGEALRINLGSGEIHMVVHAAESEVRAGLLKQIRLEGVPLLTDPGEGQTGCKEYAGRAHAPDAQLMGDGGEGQKIIVLIQRLVRDELLVFVPNGVVAAFIDQKVVFEGGLFLVGGHASLEASVGRLHLPEAVVDADHDRVVSVDDVHIVPPFPPLCGCPDFLMGKQKDGS